MAKHSFQRGEVLVIPFPYSNLKNAKKRPALVISSKLYHGTEPDIVLLAITGRVPKEIGPTDYILKDWELAGLLMPSLVKSFPVTVEPSLVLMKLGRLSSHDLTEVEKRVKLALELQ